MSKTIEGVPESITREQYLNLMRAVGIEPERVHSLVFTGRGIKATLFATDEHDCRIIDSDGYAKHEIFIRVDKPAINLSGMVV